MKAFWDQRYGQREYAYGKEPNARFRQFIDGLAPGRLLLPGEGEGRNAVYAASRGWDVTAVDQSTEARCKALALAEEQGVVIRYIVSDLASFQPDPFGYDVVSMVFVHLPPDLRTAVHHQLIDMLKPGGTFHQLAFSIEQLAFRSGGPTSPAMLYTADLLRSDLRHLEALLIREIEEDFAEGPYHQGRYRGIEAIGKRPPIASRPIAS